MDNFNSQKKSTTSVSIEDTSAITTTQGTLKKLDHLLQVKKVNFIQTKTDSIDQKIGGTEFANLQHEECLTLYHNILKHRVEYYKVSAPHLLANEEILTEKNVDQRSCIFVILKNNEILSSLRLTQRPFELENFNLHEIDSHAYDNYLEIGRLVTSPHLDPIVASLVVRSLLCAAGLWAIEEAQAHGFVAICRPYRVKFFNKFGLQNLAEFFSNQRKINYHFLAAPMDIILKTTARLQKNESSLRRRLENSFQTANDDENTVF